MCQFVWEQSQLISLSKRYSILYTYCKGEGEGEGEGVRTCCIGALWCFCEAYIYMYPGELASMALRGNYCSFGLSQAM